MRMLLFGFGIAALSAAFSGLVVSSVESRIHNHIAQQFSANYQHINEICAPEGD